jgi:hypothetical protein
VSRDKAPDKAPVEPASPGSVVFPKPTTSARHAARAGRCMQFALNFEF